MTLIIEKKLNDKLTLIQDIRKEKPYLKGLISCFFSFHCKNELDILNELNIPELLQKLRTLQDNITQNSIFWIGCIEMLLKIHSHFIYYHDSTNYQDRIAKIEQKLTKKARNFQFNHEIFTINEIFH